MDGNYLSCRDGVATLYACDGCQNNYPHDSPCGTPFCTNKRLHQNPRTA